jgi:hypothetical protein
MTQVAMVGRRNGKVRRWLAVSVAALALLGLWLITWRTYGRPKWRNWVGAYKTDKQQTGISLIVSYPDDWQAKDSSQLQSDYEWNPRVELTRRPLGQPMRWFYTHMMHEDLQRWNHASISVQLIHLYGHDPSTLEAFATGYHAALQSRGQPYVTHRLKHFLGPAIECDYKQGAGKACSYHRELMIYVPLGPKRDGALLFISCEIPWEEYPRYRSTIDTLFNKVQVSGRQP